MKRYQIVQIESQAKRLYTLACDLGFTATIAYENMLNRRVTIFWDSIQDLSALVDLYNETV